MEKSASSSFHKCVARGTASLHHPCLQKVPTGRLSSSVEISREPFQAGFEPATSNGRTIDVVPDSTTGSVLAGIKNRGGQDFYLLLPVKLWYRR